MNVDQALDAFEIRTERKIETVVQRLVLDQAGAREEIEIVDAAGYDVVLERVEEREELARRDGQLGRLQVKKEVDQQRACVLTVSGPTAGDRA